MSAKDCMDGSCCCHNPDWTDNYRYSQPNLWGRSTAPKLGWSYRICPDCGWGATPAYVGRYPAEGKPEARKKYVQKLIKRNGAGYHFTDIQIDIHRKFFCKGEASD